VSFARFVLGRDEGKLAETHIFLLRLIISDASSIRRHEIFPRPSSHDVDFDGSEESVDRFRVVLMENGSSLGSETLDVVSSSFLRCV